MRLGVYYIFIPTQGLVDFARRSGNSGLAIPSVWEDSESLETGPVHEVELVKEAFWSDFVSGLFTSPPEDVLQIEFRKYCLDAGLYGCWMLMSTNDGGTVDKLISSASKLKPLLAANGITPAVISLGCKSSVTRKADHL